MSRTFRAAALAPAALAPAALALAACGDPAAHSPTAPAPAADPALAVASPTRAAIDDDALARILALARSALSGGATTIFDATAGAFEQPAPNLGAAALALHDEGDEGFGEVFAAPGGTGRPGLGPIFDRESCEACHPGDGRGRPPLTGEQFESMLFRSSVAGTGPHGAPVAVPGFGGQLQMRAIAGFRAEVRAAVRYVDSTVTLPDGTRHTLRSPRYTLTGVYAPLPAGVLFSPRVAPAVFGLGLLEAVPEFAVRGIELLQRIDPDGVSGRANMVYDAIEGRVTLGRFGWKANTPNLVQQSAGAYNGDMGVTSSLFPAEPCEGQVPGCARHAIEVDDRTVNATAFYTQTLAVPARRRLDDPRTQRGERLFHTSGCGTCHVATLVTGALRGVPAVSNQVIHPYTDLLVHDMGPALADARPDFLAGGSEWRTAPLWGIGLVQTVNGHTNFLHDGRARSLLEAVLWHGGEARAANDRFKRLPASDRAAVIAFLQSL